MHYFHFKIHYSQFRKHADEKLLKVKYVKLQSCAGAQSKAGAPRW